MRELVSQEFERRFGFGPAWVVRAPGRVNLIGEHTDYNDGFVLPMAIDRAIWIALRPREDNRVLLHSLAFPQAADFSLEVITHGEGWTDYVHGMAWALQELGYPLGGWEGVLASEVPVGSGLSSSAALEIGIARAFWALTRWNWDGVQMALLAKTMDNEWLEIGSGIMDQMISACGQENHALLIDCRDLTYGAAPWPEGVSTVVMDTGVGRGLIDSAYNERVAQCRAAAAHFGACSLRDVTSQLLVEMAGDLDPLTLRRARHVVSENERTLQAAAAMRAADSAALGRLMDASHASLREDYEVSCLELDTMVEIAQKQPGCLGARMTGAGFGGCAIALVQTADVEQFVDRVPSVYRGAVGREPAVYSVVASAGAQLISS